MSDADSGFVTAAARSAFVMASEALAELAAAASKAFAISSCFAAK
eukprot:CAMPEP_0172839702 /NCGR_PEP_ID=MMETSP1075-20121228/28759_1 /TAXON_ID=2916 /ORGANISM="Ceratium fusus, Strain PA161109" /LENGTH=44 /DNA_ID= /DNA_START= /DNA_END= /DNA_ORIENTATION=